MKKNTISFMLIAAVALLVLAGCSTTKPEMGSLEKQLQMKEKEIAGLSSSNKDQAKALEDYRMQLNKEAEARAEAEKRYKEALASEGKTMSSDLFPPNAKPGECWARTFVPPTYRTVSETVLKKGESERVELIPAKYEFVEERVMVQAAGANLIEIPAKYEWQEERVLVEPTHTAWKKGRGPIERLDNSTGEIMCLVEVPASYKTVRKQVMTSPPGSTEIAIPAEYKTVKVRRMVTPPSERRIKIPAEYAEVTRTEKVTEGHMDWSRILCETNVDATTISRIQQALLNSGHNPGPIDGVIGSQTSAAIKSFQRKNGLAVGGLTYETVNKLGVNL